MRKEKKGREQNLHCNHGTTPEVLQRQQREAGLEFEQLAGNVALWENGVENKSREGRKNLKAAAPGHSSGVSHA